MAGLMDLFSTSAKNLESLPLEEEQSLIASAQGYGTIWPEKATWTLLTQYRGLLQTVERRVRTRVRTMTPEQLEDLQGDLVVAAIEAIQAFNFGKHFRLSQVLPGALAAVAAEMTTALTIPSGTLALWFKIWRAHDGDHGMAESMALTMGMHPDTYRAIQHALTFADSEWVQTPFNAGARPTADAETFNLAWKALAVLSPEERDVIELAYGFRGDPKTDAEVGDIVYLTRNTAKFKRTRALTKMRKALIE